MIKIKPVLLSLVIGHEVLGLPEAVGVIATAIGICKRENTRGKRSRFAAHPTISEINIRFSEKYQGG